MMKKFIYLGISAFALISLSLSACGKEPKPEGKKPEEKKPEEKVETEMISKTLTINATDYSKWVYVSLKKGEVVEVSNPKENTSWDIAFHRYDVRLNGGESGKGQGAAVKSGETGKATPLEKANKVPTEGWSTDVLGVITTKFNNGGGGNHSSSNSEEGLNEVISGKKIGGLPKGGWVDVSMEMGPRYEYSYDIYYIKLADGTVARIKLTDFFNAKVKSGHVTFSYQYPVK